MKRRVIFVIASVVLVLGLLLGSFGCAPEPAEGKILKIGIITSLNWPIGTDTVNGVDLDVKRINEAGGLLVGGERYQLEAIVDDCKMDLGLAKTAAEKQIFQDKVDFIVGDLYSMSYLDLCDENKVVVVAWPMTPEILDPKYHYCFSSSYHFTSWVTMIPWIADNWPELKTVVLAFPDRMDGHTYAEIWEPAVGAAGLTLLETQFYPVPATDVSATATRIKTLNPDFLVPYGGGPDVDSMIIKAVYTAGWNGQVVDTAPIPGGFFLGIAGPEASEGLIAGAWPVEFEPAVTDMAKEFKADWIAEYGSWTDPEEAWVIPWWILLAGLRESSSPDPDEVAAVIANGLQFECPLGEVKMISRPDYDNPRTVQAITGLYVKQVQEGKVKQIDYLSIEQQYNYAKLIYGW